MAKEKVNEFDLCAHTKRDIAGMKELVDSRPDLEQHLAPTMVAISEPTSNESNVNDRGELPPVGDEGPQNANKPWKPMGRK